MGWMEGEFGVSHSHFGISRWILEHLQDVLGGSGVSPELSGWTWSISRTFWVDLEHLQNFLGGSGASPEFLGRIWSISRTSWEDLEHLQSHLNPFPGASTTPSSMRNSQEFGGTFKGFGAVPGGSQGVWGGSCGVFWRFLECSGGSEVVLDIRRCKIDISQV